MNVYSDASQSIGKTPLVHLQRIGRGLNAKILGKVEGRNPAYSVKCRIGASMIWDAEERGALERLAESENFLPPKSAKGFWSKVKEAFTT